MNHRTVNTGLIMAVAMIGFYCSQACLSLPQLHGHLSKTENATAGSPGNSSGNSNWVIKEYRNQLTLNCSSSWNGWPVEKLIDENPYTSWFSASKDAAAFDREPWVEVSFPQDVKVSHVTALGNQEPSWRKGFSIKVGKLELYDAEGKVVYARTEQCSGRSNNFDMHLKQPVNKVRRLRFTSLADEGNVNGYSDIALGELQIE